MKVYFDSVGCRLNQAEIEKMALEFREAGHVVVDSAAQADLVVVNTCTVTAAAASDSRQKIRQAQKMGVKKIVATGCWATVSPMEAQMMPGVSNVILNADKEHLVEKILGEHAADFDLEPLERVPLPGVHRRTRAFIKVQDGCNNHCTFCVTRIARGVSVSLSKELVLKEIISAEKGGANEIVLSGVHLGSWGRELADGESLTDLIEFLLRETSIPRIRLSSIEPWDLDERFFDLWKDSRLCPHFHLPLQSGCAATLKRMVRHTTPELYRGLIQLVRSKLPEAAITTDIIVGFPGETETEFQESLRFVEEMQYASGHVFKYSAREGTAANKLAGKINGKIAHERSQKMREVLVNSEARYHQKFLDSQVQVLWESVSALAQGGWRLHGLTENYLPVTAWNQENLWNSISQVKLLKISGNSLEGEIVH